MRRIDQLALGCLVLLTTTAAAQGIPGRATVEELLRRDSEKALANASAPVPSTSGMSLVVPNLGVTVPPIGATPTAMQPEPVAAPLVVTAIYGVAPAYTVEILASGKPFKLTLGKAAPHGSPYALVSIAGKCATFTRAKSRESACYAPRGRSDDGAGDASARIAQSPMSGGR